MHDGFWDHMCRSVLVSAIRFKAPAPSCPAPRCSPLACHHALANPFPDAFTSFFFLRTFPGVTGRGPVPDNVVCVGGQQASQLVNSCRPARRLCGRQPVDSLP